MKSSLLKAMLGSGLRDTPQGIWPRYGHAVSYNEIQKIASGGAVSNTMNLPGSEGADWLPGDLAIAYAFRTTDTTAITVPGGWSSIIANAGNTCSEVAGYRLLITGDTTIGTWTNATHVQVIILRDVHPTSFLGRYNAIGGSSATMSWSSTLLAEPREMRDWLVFFGASRSATNVNANITGLTNENPSQTNMAMHTRRRDSTDWAGVSLGVNVNTGWRTITMQIRAKELRSGRLR